MSGNTNRQTRPGTDDEKVSPEQLKKGEIRKKNVTKGYIKKEGAIVFPRDHDIRPFNVESYIIDLEKLLKSGNEVLIISKPTLSCIKMICDKFINYKSHILFKFTICSQNNGILRLWEPEAPPFEERLESLKYAFRLKYNTSISIEPFLDNYAAELVDAVRPYVTDSIWIGEANSLRNRLKWNRKIDEVLYAAAKDLLALYNSDYKFELYERFKADSKIKWRDSIKKAFTTV